VNSRCRLPRTARIANDERAEILRAAPRQRGRWFVVRRAGNDQQYARVMIRVAKPVLRSAVARNRIKRCVREVFRHQRALLPPFDFFVSLIYPYKEPSLLAAQQELKRLLRS